MKHAVTVLPADKTVFAEEGESLLDVLAQNGFFLPAACGGKGTCGKCRVRLIKGGVKGTEADADGWILSCRARVIEDLQIELPEHKKGASERLGTGDARSVNAKKTGVALDIGTTTLAAALVDCDTGEILSTASRLNPQGVCGADVLARIVAYGEGKGEIMQTLILDTVRDMIEELTPNTGAESLVIAANTTMLHLFLGEDPTSIGAYPFIPRFTDAREKSGAELGLNLPTVRLLPSVSAYIGADVTAGAIACGMDGSEQTLLLVDVGTNGEILLVHKGSLYATSAAAGPALEGACIECGMGGTEGAINHVDVLDGTLSFDTVGAKPAVGICGCGLIDLVALLVREGVIDESGAWSDDSSSPLMRYLHGDRFVLCEGVYLSQKDIRQLQLAKAAISAAIEALLTECGVAMNEIDEVFLAGGLGYYMNISNAAEIGLIPSSLASRSRAVGNTSLLGAVKCLSDPAANERIQALSRRVRVVELSFSKAFQDAYIENMMF